MKTRTIGLAICAIAILFSSLALQPASSLAQTCTPRVQRVSVSTNGQEGNGNSAFPGISASGRFVVFESFATNLVASDTNGTYDVFLRDRDLSITTRESLSSNGTQSDGDSRVPGDGSISANGDLFVFQSTATNLVAGDTNAAKDIFVRERISGITERVSVSSSSQSNGDSFSPTISADGQLVAFQSNATNLVENDTNGVGDVFLRDRLTDITERISISSSGEQGNNISGSPTISNDGRYVAFHSLATNLDPVNPGSWHVFVRDRTNNTTTLLSVSTQGSPGDNGGLNPAMSGDGRFVVFDSPSTNLVSGDTNGRSDIFLRDTVAATTVRVSIDTAGSQANSDSWQPAISADGSSVAFHSSATNLVPNDSNLKVDMFVRNLLANTTSRISVGRRGREANGPSSFGSLNSEGHFAAYLSAATNLVQRDRNGKEDVFVYERPSDCT